MKLIAGLLFFILTGAGITGELDSLIEFALKNNPRLKSYERLKESLKHRG
ncbi:MAG: hypothetical protein Q9N34_02470 [Aquificota bacterium]|nr:hypothetical protein [Aquificota bacterium]